MPELKNLRHERLCQEFMIDLNQTQAAIRTGYSPRTANTQAARLFANVNIRARVDELLAQRSARTGVTADRVVRELARLAFADITQVVDVDRATVLPDVSEDDRATIASVKVKSSPDFTEREIKGWDKLKALELLGKHLGMYTDNVRITDDRPTIVDDIPDGGGDG
ncbi:MAG: terminase small subunit [Christensenellaceae bacterium]|nr:terminase small subunit [Christensenellaceae bacterium]MEA5067150.1 terminase small subunit [Eubacteriales bacterium]MEA5069628.1 terminase small subunit [Christensenellaceae bacterium]